MLDKELIELARRTSKALRNAAILLSQEFMGNEVRDCLMRWGIVLCVLSADVTDGVCDLLIVDNRRAANMLSRALVDYDVRLRYYYVQAIPRVAALISTPDKKQYIIAEIAAVRDWNNANAKFVNNVINKYDPTTWPDDLRDKIESQLQLGEKSHESKFSEMNRYLDEHESNERGVPQMLRFIGDWTRKHNLPAWVMQSLYLHGDQGVVSDVFEKSSADDPGLLHISPSYDASISIMATSLLHAAETLRSAGFVRPAGWIPEAGSIHFDLARAYLAATKHLR